MKFAIAFHFTLVSRTPNDLDKNELSIINVLGDNSLLTGHLSHNYWPLVNFETIVNLKVLNFDIQNSVCLTSFVSDVDGTPLSSSQRPSFIIVSKVK